MQFIRFGSAVVLAFVIAGCCSWCTGPLSDNVRVHNIYQSNMVLQRGKPIRFAGSAEAGKAVQVEFAGSKVHAVADAKGQWVAEFPARPAGGPFTVRISGAKNSKQTLLENVMVGEVYLASGQSNMEMPVFSQSPFWRTADAKKEVQEANYPMLRIFHTAKKVAPAAPVAQVTGKWEVCTPDSIGKFSAFGYFFGRELMKKLNVPVGIIHSSWGGTPIESWISFEGYKAGDRKTELAKIEAVRKAPVPQKLDRKKMLEEAKKKFSLWERDFYSTDPVATQKALAQWSQPGFDDSKWQSVDTIEEFSLQKIGAFWVRHVLTLPDSWAGKDITLKLGAFDDYDETFFNGEKVGRTGSETKNFWSAPRNYKVPGKFVKAGKNVLAVRIVNTYGAGGHVGNPPVAVCGKEKVVLKGLWRTEPEFVADVRKIGERPPLPEIRPARDAYFPGTLYNGMVAAWTDYPIRGFIWYQGESNAGRYQDYWTLHRLLIADWRKHWGDAKMPFIFVQLAAYERHSPKNRLAEDFWVGRAPADDTWSKLREVQLETLRDPYAGMVVAIDCGDAFDIHPRDKQTLGKRAVAEAMRIVEKSPEVSQGPIFEKAAFANGEAVLSFRNVGSGLKARGDKLNCFAIAGKDGKFVWADAKIVKNQVIVSSPLVKEPAMVRYAWARFPGNPNLYNQEGFPASPFRTDKPDYLR
ncbi:MAG: sialate O-acetylesterase [Victivallaceae bacterium]|nr:sialate O-acetylesterase [Victivallaceae bacterium]